MAMVETLGQTFATRGMKRHVEELRVYWLGLAEAVVAPGRKVHVGGREALVGEWVRGGGEGGAGRRVVPRVAASAAPVGLFGACALESLSAVPGTGGPRGGSEDGRHLPPGAESGAHRVRGCLDRGGRGRS